MPGDKTELAHSILKKQFRFSDWMAERVIKTVAFLSITIVVLIFVFVFRETLPLFHTQNKENITAGNTTAGSDGGLQPESYSSGEPESADLKPEIYGALPDSTPEKVEDSVAIPAEITAYIGSLPQSENRKAIGTFLSRDWQPVSENPRYGLMPFVLRHPESNAHCHFIRCTHLHTGRFVYSHVRSKKNQGIHQTGR